MNQGNGRTGHKVALVVEEFLPFSQVWIWRQLNVDGLQPEIILTKKISNASIFNHPRIIVGTQGNLFLRKVKKKLWFIFRRQKPQLNQTTHEKFKKALVENNITLVHAHFGTVACEVLDLCRELNIKLVVTFHAFDVTAVPVRWPGYKAKLAELFRYLSSAIAISAFIARQVKDLGCDENKINVIYLGVPVEDLQFVDRRQRNGPIRFLHIGRITEKKGVPDLVRAFVRAFPAGSSAELVVIGSGEQYDEVDKLIGEVKAANRIILKQAVRPEDVKIELSQADVFVLNSRTDSNQTTEGLPVTLLEAMATGLPVISTVHAGIPEAVTVQTGFLIPERDTQGLTTVLGRMLDRQKNFEMGKSGRQLIEQKFSSGHCNDELKNLYTRLQS